MFLKISPAIPPRLSGIIASDCVTILSDLLNSDVAGIKPNPLIVPWLDSFFSSSIISRQRIWKPPQIPIIGIWDDLAIILSARPL